MSEENEELSSSIDALTKQIEDMDLKVSQKIKDKVSQKTQKLEDKYQKKLDKAALEIDSLKE